MEPGNNGPQVLSFLVFPVRFCPPVCWNLVWDFYLKKAEVGIPESCGRTPGSI
jgi:hypothetical protein